MFNSLSAQLPGQLEIKMIVFYVTRILVRSLDAHPLHDTFVDSPRDGRHQTTSKNSRDNSGCKSTVTGRRPNVVGSVSHGAVSVWL